MTKENDEDADDSHKPPGTENILMEKVSAIPMESKQNNSATEFVIVSPVKKQMAVHWSDLKDQTHGLPKFPLGTSDGSPHKVCLRNRLSECSAEKDLSSSSTQNPDLTLEELESQLKKKESKIVHACKLELYFLDNMNKARGKRLQMVSELQEIRGKIRKLSEEAAKKDHFMLPPVPTSCAKGRPTHSSEATFRSKETK